MNWDNQLSSIISAADGSVAKIRRAHGVSGGSVMLWLRFYWETLRPGIYVDVNLTRNAYLNILTDQERLATHGRLSRGREDMYPERDLNRAVGFDPPTPPLLQTGPAPTGAVKWTDLAAIQAQLHSQSQAIESLTQNLRAVERERNAQQRQIQTLQEEVRRLEERLTDREKGRERDLQSEGEKDPAVERRLEQWKREVERELSSLRGHINRASSLGNQEESFSSKLRREGVERLSREVDLLKSKLVRQEEDVYQQRLDSRETKSQCERSCKTLESITDSYHTHRLELVRITSQCERTQQEVRDLRLTVSELKEELRGLNFRQTQGRLSIPEVARKSTPSVAAVAVETRPRRRLLSRLDLEDDFSPTPSLGDVSSDDLDASWLEDLAPKLRSQGREERLSLSGSDLSDAAGGLESNHSDTDGKLGCVSDSSQELSLSDL